MTYLALARLGGGDEVLFKEAEDVLADLVELGLNGSTVLAVDGDVLLVTLLLFLLLDRRNNAPRGTTGANDVLKSDRQEVTLLHAELVGAIVSGGGNLPHLRDHLCEKVTIQERKQNAMSAKQFLPARQNLSSSHSCEVDPPIRSLLDPK